MDKGSGQPRPTNPPTTEKFCLGGNRNCERAKGECLPGACPARHLCIKYPISSPKLIPTQGIPPSRLH